MVLSGSVLIARKKVRSISSRFNFSERLDISATVLTARLATSPCYIEPPCVIFGTESESARNYFLQSPKPSSMSSPSSSLDIYIIRAIIPLSGRQPPSSHHQHTNNPTTIDIGIINNISIIKTYPTLLPNHYNTIQVRMASLAYTTKRGPSMIMFTHDTRNNKDKNNNYSLNSNNYCNKMIEFITSNRRHHHPPSLLLSTFMDRFIFPTSTYCTSLS